MEVKIELGHKACKNIKPTKEGYTHDWTVFVQGVNGNEIKHIVEKVIFRLPDSYPDPNRMKETPPYVLSESSSQSLSIQIDIFFCPEAKLRKVHYVYDVFICDEAVNISWERKLAFPNPSKEFKEKLLLVGGELTDLLKTFPVITGEVLKIKDEPVDEIQIANNINEATLNTGVQKIDNLQNECNTNSERELRFDELLEENKKLKKANVEVKEKIDLQEKLMVYYEENFSRYEANILSTNLDIDKLKKKIEADEKEIITLKLELQMLQVKNKLVQIENPSIDLPEKSTRGTKRKNEDLNISAAIGKEKENIIHSAQFSSSYSSTSPNSSLLKNAFVSIENQNVCETVKSKSAISIAQNASVNETPMELNDLHNVLSKSCLSSYLENKTQPLNDDSSNVYKNQDSKILESSKDVSSAITSSAESTNTYCNVEKSITGEKNKTDAILDKLSIKNDNAESVNQSLVKVNSLNTSKIKNDAEKSAKGKSAEAGFSFNISEVITIDAKKPAKRRSDSANFSLNTPEIIIIDDDESANGSSVKANISSNVCEIIDVEKSAKGISSNVSVNKPDSRNIEKSMFGSSMEVNSLNTPEITSSLNTPEIKSSLNIPEIKSVNTPEINYSLNTPEIIIDFVKFAKKCSANANTTLNKTQEKLGNPIQEHLVSSTKRTGINFSNLSRKQKRKLSNLDNTAILSLTSSDTKHANKKKKKKQKKHKSTVKSNTPETVESVNKLCDTNKKIEQPSSSIEKTTKTSNSNSKENSKSIDQVEFSSLTPIDTKLSKKQRKRMRSMKNLKVVCQSETMNLNSSFEKFDQDLNDTSAPKFVSFLTEHCMKLATELSRIKNSEFCKYRLSENSLFSKLENIDTNQITDERFFQYVHSLIDYFSDPKILDMPTLIYLVVDYLHQNRMLLSGLPTYIQNQNICVFISPSENCIVHALFEVERKSLPHLDGLIYNTLRIIHQVIISKKGMSPNGLSSLCRVFMEICKCKKDRWGPLFLCCDLLRLENPLAPYLIVSLAAVWRDPFSLYDNFSVEENMVLGSIHYGMRNKPVFMSYGLWSATVGLQSIYFPRPFIISHIQAIQFLTNEIVSRCERGLFENIWMLASPLLIFVSRETLEWKIGFRIKYLIPNLLHFSLCSNEQAFSLFCNLFVDIFSFSSESPYDQILQFFTNQNLHRGVKFVQDCAAVTLMKYIGITDRSIPAFLRDWFLRNQDSLKLTVILDLYCRKVMESRNYSMRWDDIIIL